MKRSSVFTLLIGVLLALSTSGALASEGHDHGDAEQTPSADGPQRLPDGTVFLPKPAQRQFGLRTQVTEASDLPRSIELNGKVTMDPNAAGRVQAAVAGRIEGGPNGLPSPGQQVRKGQVLAWVTPTTAAIERSNQSAQLAELKASKALAARRLTRLRGLADTVPRKEIDAAESEAVSLGHRIAAVSGGLDARDALVAPVNGIIAAAHIVAGQIVDAREVVFEIVDPTRFRIEALAFDPEIATDVGGATLALGSEKVALQFIGASRILREQALPLYFSLVGNSISGLALGQPVKLQLQSRSTIRGIPVPAASLMRDPSNRTIVWVKTAPERFASRPVVTAPLDGIRVAVTSGLEPGERIATQGAALLNQIR